MLLTTLFLLNVFSPFIGLTPSCIVDRVTNCRGLQIFIDRQLVRSLYPLSEFSYRLPFSYNENTNKGTQDEQV